MPTRNIVPRANGEGGIGTSAKHWGNGYFDNLSLAGEDVAGTLSDMDLALAESTGYGIVSGCEPSISGLTVTVGAGVVHLANGTRKELSASTVTLDAADTTNPRIDLVYIDSTGAVAKITGTAAASPSAPNIPDGCVGLYELTIPANASGIGSKFSVMPIKCNYVDDIVKYHFPKNYNTNDNGLCVIIETKRHVIMIDSQANKSADVINYMISKNINHVDMFFLTHYHGDHYGNINDFIEQSVVDFSHCKWYLPRFDAAGDSASSTEQSRVIGYLSAHGYIYEYVDSNRVIHVEKNVKLSLLNCNQSDYDYYVNAGYVGGDEGYYYNVYSMAIMVEHGNERALFEGDSFKATRIRLWNEYREQIKHVDLLQIGHHGLGDGFALDDEKSAIPFIRTISPKYAVCCVSSNNNYLSGEELGILRMMESEIHSTQNDSVEFISTPNSMINVTNGVTRIAGYSNKVTSLTIYVDSSVNPTANPGEGTQEKPYATIQAALNACNFGNMSIPIIINLADGIYDEAIIYGGYVKITGTTFTIKTLIAKNANINVSADTNATINYLNIENSSFDFNRMTLKPKTATSIIYNSKGNISICYIYGNETTDISLKLLRIMNSTYYSYGLYIYNTNNQTTATIHNAGSSMFIQKLYLNNVNIAFDDSVVSEYYVEKIEENTNVTKVFKGDNVSFIKCDDIFRPTLNITASDIDSFVGSLISWFRGTGLKTYTGNAKWATHQIFAVVISKYDAQSLQGILIGDSTYTFWQSSEGVITTHELSQT